MKLQNADGSNERVGKIQPRAGFRRPPTQQRWHRAGKHESARSTNAASSQTDDRQQTADEHILAIGDVAGEPMLAHKAAHQGKVAVEALHGEPAVFEPQAIPAVVFTDPEIAWAGLTEEQAKREGREVEVIRYPWAASGRAVSLGRTEGLTKFLIDPDSERVLGRRHRRRRRRRADRRRRAGHRNGLHGPRHRRIDSSASRRSAKRWRLPTRPFWARRRKSTDRGRWNDEFNVRRVNSVAMIRFFVSATYSKASIAWTQNVVAPQTDRRRIGRFSQTSGSCTLYLYRSRPNGQRGAVAPRVSITITIEFLLGQGDAIFQACSRCISALAAFSASAWTQDCSGRCANRAPGTRSRS